MNIFNCWLCFVILSLHSYFKNAYVSAGENLDTFNLEIGYSADFDKIIDKRAGTFKRIMNKAKDELKRRLSYVDSAQVPKHGVDFHAAPCNIDKFFTAKFEFTKYNHFLIVKPMSNSNRGKVNFASKVCFLFNGRPWVSEIEISPNYRVDKESEQQTMLWLMHTILHGLAFKKDILGHVLLNECFKNDKILQYLKDHFKCPTIDCAHIEKEIELPNWSLNQCLDDDLHWKTLHYGDDIMAYPPGPLFTELTNALLNATGFLLAHKESDETVWAKNRGCAFLQGCDSLNNEKKKMPGSTYPFCNWQDYILQQSVTYRCDLHHTGPVACDWKTWTNDTDEKALFLFDTEKFSDGEVVLSGKNLAGSDRIYENCAVWKKVYNNTKKILKACDLLTFQEVNKNWGLEVYNDSSICVEQKRVDVMKCTNIFDISRTKISGIGAGCYDHICRDGRLHIKAYSPKKKDLEDDYMDQYLTCWGAGNHIYLSRDISSLRENYMHRVMLVCPDCKRVCERGNRGSKFKCLPDIPGIESRDFIKHPCGACSAMSMLWLLLLLLTFSFGAQLYA